MSQLHLNILIKYVLKKWMYSLLNQFEIVLECYEI